MTTIADDIWVILREITQIQKELQEDNKDFQKRQKELQEGSKELQEGHKKCQEDTKALREAQQQTELEIKATNASIGRLGNRLGEFVEEAVRPSAVRLFKERGLDVHEVQQNVSAKREGEGIEIDLLVINDKEMVVIECKSNLGLDDVNDHLERLEKMKRLMPRYKDYRISGAVAGMVIADNVAAYAMRKGLYVIGQNGEHLELRNDTVFLAKAW
jgi:hypothetical protein